MVDLSESGVADSCDIDDSVTIVAPVNLYGCSIGAESFIGPFVEIQRGVSLGPRVKVQSHSFLCEGVTIGAESFIGHGVMFINDKFELNGPAKGDRRYWHSTEVGENVSIGSNATILPVRICDRTVIGAGSVVVKDITHPGVYAGNPARFIRNL